MMLTLNEVVHTNGLMGSLCFNVLALISLTWMIDLIITDRCGIIELFFPMENRMKIDESCPE